MHSKFPWTTHSQTPTAVFDADGKRIVDQWVAPDGWLPIETAPMDGTYVLIGEDHRESCGEAYYSGEEHRWYWANTQPGDYPDPHQPFPTHWQPMPAPPSDKPAPTPLDPETAADNAALIAAIPRMVEALERLCNAVAEIDDWIGDGADEVGDAYADGRTVLASIGSVK